ncbi:DUF1295 domain-containing protein [Paenibacillus sp. M1]|uniref:DUF1295 domain-containing protein n=1 Tax=Paenibacillus haidiansis TaxID=1574488 RepID=A0ABU7VT91_9BACL
MSFHEAWSIAFDKPLAVLLIVCAVLCAIGFYKYVYFLSIGYGLAVAGSGVALIAMYLRDISVGSLLQCLLFVLYGIRLAGFLIVREAKSSAYRKTLQEVTKGEATMPVFVKAAIWISVSLLYVAQVSPVFYRLNNEAANGVMPIIGAVIMAIALIIEAVADRQKSRAKAMNPNRFCDTGLYQYVRCPNYFGEILFWTGVFLSGFGALTGAVQWAIAILGYIMIVYIMFNGAKRLERRQDRNYGDSDEYNAYVEKTPILLPLVPLYHLKDVKWM